MLSNHSCNCLHAVAVTRLLCTAGCQQGQYVEQLLVVLLLVPTHLCLLQSHKQVRWQHTAPPRHQTSCSAHRTHTQGAARIPPLQQHPGSSRVCELLQRIAHTKKRPACLAAKSTLSAQCPPGQPVCPAPTAASLHTKLTLYPVALGDLLCCCQQRAPVPARHNAVHGST